MDETTVIVGMTAEIVSAYIGNSPVQQEDLSSLIRQVHRALSDLATRPVAPPAQPLIPAVPIKKSVTADYIVCLDDGRKLKSLKRYLRAKFDLTPAQYRAKWDLPSDYPMVAPAYAATRSALAKATGLGRKAALTTQTSEPVSGQNSMSVSAQADANVSEATVSISAPAPAPAPAPATAKPRRGGRLHLPPVA